MLTLVVFAITSTAICFMDGKDWFYHRLPATIATILALLCWAASVLVHRRPADRRAVLPAAVAGIAFVVFLVAAFQRRNIFKKELTASSIGSDHQLKHVLS